MTRLVMDIETVGMALESLEPADRWEVDRWAERVDDPQEVYAKLALNALTGRVVAIGMLNPDTSKGRIYIAPETVDAGRSADGNAEFVPMSERGMLAAFWRDVAKYDQVITFNGRGFDVPFLLYRSAAYRIAPTVNLLSHRYSSTPHCDLQDQLGFYGAAWPRRSLHFFCRLFGIESPKEPDIHGANLGALWSAERYHEIAEYCWRDVTATGKLDEVWRE